MVYYLNHIKKNKFGAEDIFTNPMSIGVISLVLAVIYALLCWYKPDTFKMVGIKDDDMTDMKNNGKPTGKFYGMTLVVGLVIFLVWYGGVYYYNYAKSSSSSSSAPSQ
jgi:hypothetical protein